MDFPVLSDTAYLRNFALIAPTAFSPSLDLLIKRSSRLQSWHVTLRLANSPASCWTNIPIAPPLLRLPPQIDITIIEAVILSSNFARPTGLPTPTRDKHTVLAASRRRAAIRRIHRDE